MKLGYYVCESTIAKYMAREPGPSSQTWQTFIRNHMAEIASMDFFTVPTVTFRTLYVFLILSLDRRRIIHFNVTSNPTAEWTSLQLIQAFPFDTAPRYLIRDRDSIYGPKVIGTIRRECLDHIIVLGEKHLRRVLKKYLAYYHESRTHLGLEKDTPGPRAVQPLDAGPVTGQPILGGLHHRYYREAA